MYHNSPEYKELKQLSARICTVCREMAAGMKEALLNKNEKAAEAVISQDEELNDYSLKSDELCGKIIALYWPRGSDMRYILSAIKTSADFERIGDHCKHVCRRMLKVSSPVFFSSDALRLLTERVSDSVSEAVTAYYAMDCKRAMEIIKNDIEIDLLKNDAVKDIIQTISGSGYDVNIGVHMVNAARRLERMADHAKHIAEAVLFTVSGKFDNKEIDNEEDIADRG